MKFLLTGDLHYRTDIPKCRKDDFLKAQNRCLSSIFDVLFKERKILWLDAGDFFHRARSGLLSINQMLTWCTTKCSRYFVKGTLATRVFCVAGNHDLPNHNLRYLGDSALGVMISANYFELLGSFPKMFTGVHIYGASYEEEIPQVVEKDVYNILVAHTMIYETKRDSEAARFGNGISAHEFLEKYPDYNLIVTGHNHQHFVVSSGTRCLVNPGCITRQSVTEADYTPRAIIFDTDNLTYKERVMPHGKDEIERNYLGDPDDGDDELSVFVQNLEAQEEFALSFEKNVQKVMEEQESNYKIRDLVRELLDAGKQ